MNKLVVATVFTLAAAIVGSDTASAQQPVGNLGFLPYGFYMPYGARYGTSVRQPPYFALNPPVYYGSRHARPYGVSPFASPPVVRAGETYNSRLRTQFEQPLVPTPGPAPRMQCNPCLSSSKALTVEPREVQVGAVRTNPFVQPSARIAKN